eukprot:s4217_g1.t1
MTRGGASSDPPPPSIPEQRDAGQRGATAKASPAGPPASPPKQRRGSVMCYAKALEMPPKDALPPDASTHLQYVLELHTYLIGVAKNPHVFQAEECLLKVPDEAMPIELQAILESEFIRDHDRLRRQGNRMHRHFGLSKRCLDVWVSLPYDVAQHALSIFMLEQVSAHHFKVPDDELQAMEAEMADEIQIMNVGEDPNRYVGTIRKWDSERGFGFIVQPQPEEETGEEDHKDRLRIAGWCGETSCKKGSRSFVLDCDTNLDK